MGRLRWWTTLLTFVQSCQIMVMSWKVQGAGLPRLLYLLAKLGSPVFKNSVLSVLTKRVVYKAVMLPVLLYGAETWTLKAEYVRHLTFFHNRCVRTILGVTKYKQLEQRLTVTTKILTRRFGVDRRLKWLGQLGHMEEGSFPKNLLFGE